MADINIVPYIDVMLVLLVVFMITAPLINQGVEIDLPEAQANPLPAEEVQPLVLRIDKERQFYLDVGDGGADALDSQTVLARAAAALRRNPTTAVIVEADSGVDYGTVVLGMTLLQRAGAERVGLATRPPEE
jgi:biopolymer transport protein TolR